MKKTPRRADRTGRAEKTTKQYRVIGKGHSGCFSLVMKSWWIQENFTNVIFYCKEAGFKRTQLRANASILAAASPFFRTLLADYSGLEEDATIMLPDYTRASVFYALQYIYTGQVALKASKQLQIEVKDLLVIFGLMFQTTTLMTADERLSSFRLKAAAQEARNNASMMEKQTTMPVMLERPEVVALNVMESDSPAKKQDAVRPGPVHPSPVCPGPVAVKRIPSPERRPLILSYSKKIRKTKISPGNGIDCVQTEPEKVNLDIPVPPEDTSKTSSSSVEKHTLRTAPLPSEPTQISATTFVQSLQREMQVWGPATTVTEPLSGFTYDPSPQYLQHIPVKQYSRRSNTERPVARNTRVSGSKVHITSQVVPVTLGKDSIFADVSDCSDAGEHNYALNEHPISEARVPAQSSEELDKIYEGACRLLDGEKERRRRLKRVIKRLEARIVTIRKKSTQLSRERVTKKNKKQENKDTTVCCDTCGKMVKSSWIKNHKKTHEDHQHCCDQCGRTFSLRSLFLLHYKRQHRDLIAETGGHPCTVCGQVFKLPKYLKHHMTRHTGEKPYACKYCNLRFRSEMVRSNHQRVHTGERPFVCDICGKGFAQKATLTIHLRAHEKSKRMNGVTAKGRPCFQCKHCSAQFQQEPNYLEHVARHTGDVPILPCKNCHRVFTSVRDLKQHQDSHLEKTYTCEFCGKVFNKRSMYYCHRSQVHQDMVRKSKFNAGRDEQESESSNQLLIES